MAKKIATELEALSIGGGHCNSYSANRAVTKAQAVSFGCTIRITYADNLLVGKLDLLKITVTPCSCYNHSRTMCTTKGYLASCTCRGHQDKACTCNGVGTTTWCNCKGTYTASCTCRGHSTTMCVVKTYTKTSAPYGHTSSCPSANQGECWPNGNWRNINACTSYDHGTCNVYNGKKSIRMCGCYVVALNCSKYSGTTPVSGYSQSSCICQLVYKCGCQQIMLFDYTCSCESTVCSCNSGNGGSALNEVCNCKQSVCDCNGGYGSCNKCICVNANGGSAGSESCSCNNKVCNCNSGNCNPVSNCICNSGNCERNCPSDNS